MSLESTVIDSRWYVMHRALGTVAMCLVFVLPARAQQPPPSVSDTADRPGFADSPILLGRVEPGRAQHRLGRHRSNVDAALIGYADLSVGSGSVSSGYADPLAASPGRVVYVL